MKATIYTRYGSPDVIELKDVEKPVPTEKQVLIKVHAASLNMYDWHFLTADIIVMRTMAGFLKPKDPRLGADVAGVVEAVGSQVTKFKPGDAVFGDGAGTFAEYAVASEGRLAMKPALISFEQAAAVPMAGVTALQGLRDKGGIQAGQKVLINGSAGGVGTFAVQLAKYFGAEVTAVCSTRNQDLMRTIGADHVIDYTRENFTRGKEHYDLIFVANGYQPLWAIRRALRENGSYIMAGGAMAQVFQLMLLKPLFGQRGNKKTMSMMAKIVPVDLTLLGDLVETGKIKPVIDRCFPLNDIAEAMRYLGTHHARGKIVINVA